jgi:16S rRNA (guanine527-N7)-methyltransferase
MTDVPRETSVPRLDASPVANPATAAAPAAGAVVPPAPPAAGAVVPPAPPAAAVIFGSRLATATAYARLLAGDGVTRGLLGPREVPRIWDRHLLNCAAVAELLAPDATVTDVGSGAGLPGIPLALARPDLHLELLEPLQRRVVFLREAVSALGLDRIQVVRGRAEDVRRTGGVDVVTARAVAPLSRLAGWCLPLLRPGGSLIALKGSQASAELDAAADDLRRLGAVAWEVVTCGLGLVDPPTTVVRVIRGDADVLRSGHAGRGRKGRP